MTETLTRRERIRRDTSAEILRIAVELLVEGGPSAVALRSIARRIGMTPAALYGYFPTRDDLVTELVAQMYDDLLAAVERGRDSASDPAGRVLGWAAAYRQWALENPGGFRLVYGDPVPGYRAPTEGPSVEAEQRACAALSDLVARVWPDDRREDGGFRFADFAPELVEAARAVDPEVPPAAVAFTLRAWGRIHGLVALEVHGHLDGLTDRVGDLHRAEVVALLAELGHVVPDL